MYDEFVSAGRSACSNLPVTIQTLVLPPKLPKEQKTNVFWSPSEHMFEKGMDLFLCDLEGFED